MLIGNPIRIGEPYQRVWEFTGGNQAVRRWLLSTLVHVVGGEMPVRSGDE
jgi:hypothetical protein